MTVHGPVWRVDRDNPAFHELQAEAVGEARAQAERYAVALGGHLGRLIELADDGHAGRHYAVATSGAFKRPKSATQESERPGLESLDLSPVPVRLSASVNARWYLDLPDS